MQMRGEGMAHGAVSVINAIATGRGGAIGIELPVKARVRILDEPTLRYRVFLNNKAVRCDDRLIKAVRDLMFKRLGLEGGLDITIHSTIPIGKGLKSSSAVANALVKALADASSCKLTDMEVIKLGVIAAKRAKLTITGAFDDACASHLGGLCLTDNKRKKLLLRRKIDECYVVIHVPRRTVLTRTLRRRGFDYIRPYVDKAFRIALKGDWREAILINSWAYINALGYDDRPIVLALKTGVDTAGLSGTGPAVFALVSDPQDVVQTWQEAGYRDIIVTKVRNG